jgi:hypothetical protein
MLLPRPPGLVQNLMRFVRGQPLVPQVNGQSRERSKLGSKCLRLGSLRTGLSRQMHWIANHDPHHAKPPGQSRQRPQVLPGNARRRPSPLQRQHRLGGKPQLVRHSNPDAAIADVESEIAGNRSQLVTPGFQISAFSLKPQRRRALHKEVRPDGLAPQPRYNQI